jgi:O-antigen ligase
MKLFSNTLHNSPVQTSLTMAVAISLPLLMLFPSPAGWLAGVLTLIGFFCMIRYREFRAIDWHFAALCMILPAAQIWNMLVMGWAPGVLFRPTHLLWALMIYWLIGHYGIHRNTLFYSACAASLAALAIAVFEVVYLGNERVFGLGDRWNAVPFGNFSMLFAFFCLCGAFTSSAKDRWLTPRLASILSGTRGGWLAIPFLIGLCFFFNDRLSRRARITSMVLVVVTILAVFAGSERIRERIDLAIHQVSIYLAHPANAAAQNTSTGLRLSMWHWGLEKFSEHPYTGVGLAAYKDEKKEAVENGEVPKAFEGYANLHNEFITALALGGLPSAAALIAFWVIGWRFFSSKLKGDDDDQHFFALCGLVTILGTGLFSMTEGLFGTSAGTKAIMLALALPAGALRYVTRKSTYRE